MIIGQHQSFTAHVKLLLACVIACAGVCVMKEAVKLPFCQDGKARTIDMYV